MWFIGFDLQATVLALAILAIAMAMLQAARGMHVSRRLQQTAHLLRRRREQFSNMSRILHMTEQLGDFGVWQYCLTDQRQDWTRGLQELFGIDASEEFKEGDAETLLQANGIDLVVLAQDASTKGGVISSEFKVQGLDGKTRILEMRMCAIGAGKAPANRIFAVFLDVTRQSQREERLQHFQRLALAEAIKARNEANLDPLTELANRRFVMRDLDRRLSVLNADRGAMSLIFFDVDHFKSVNDEHGHLVGDKVLKRIARIAKEQARDGDLVGRIGGEEFVWVAQSADTATARTISERLRRAIALGSGVGGLPAVTISIGFVTAEPGDSSLALFARADEALYEAKNNGRNTVRMAA